MKKNKIIGFRLFLLAALCTVLTWLYLKSTTPLIPDAVKADQSPSKEVTKSSSTRKESPPVLEARSISKVTLTPISDGTSTEPHDRIIEISTRRPVVSISPEFSIEFQLDDGLSIHSVESSSSGQLYLVKHGGSSGYAIYDSVGMHVEKLPMVEELLPGLNPRTRFQWTWGRGDKLIASLGFIDEVQQNQYPDSDTVAYDFRFYSFDRGTKKLMELIPTSDQSTAGLLRLDGVTEEEYHPV